MKSILFLHGALSSKVQFSQLIHLLQNSYACHSLNFDGHGGEMIPPQGLTFDTFSNNILSYMNKNEIEKTNLFGFSMGGYAALYFARLHPERVEKIITINVKFNWDPISTAKETGFLDPDKMMEKVPLYANNLMIQHGFNIWENLLKNTSDMMHKLAETIVLSDEELATIKTPVLLGIGDRDITSSIKETEHAYKLLPHAQLLVLPGTGHPFEKIDVDYLQLVLKKYFI